ncbi:MazG-like family protein [Liquorilactobacillus mali]|uniref:ArpR family protein n=1 Tax=Liquorilactobacillus mali KCTC 3596 = DSM 20444 TaxID=1046596 RepID=J0UU69_9LACO|nr:MazG-like family protein [Liquorilactobacillus mali]EJF01255.1 hypothetical protein LMA_01804 [Liquorilactobacillus mali KCTC 3596 = DSM 20444]KRN08964.1 hypothetical protein FD00_GL001528 [Liquorilactobacillus mali KCTC 3596 = DSM 20444]MDC7953585.1 MazG-like family protein [Liquorilactobacillus mali]QFQ74991.1 hypothetical protein LM596_07600 [Liquorilactobacillus mali]
MKYSEMIKRVQSWAKERGLDKTDPHAQGLKIAEEMGEMFQAFLKGRKEDELDAVGDLQVTLIIYCLQRGINYEKCLANAYSVIENRKGKTVDGIFIKQEDIE